ncbi:hypothetical protein PR048_030925 [Dryococelus australis]|uniref:Uncharacterized protein n=1 Tax=Dryococelus australis TaxID=614101 RepID=A0ABQ9GA91_9NEOP|nr:hypothetical protein PR048_030925 [Dryococelus australis]
MRVIEVRTEQPGIRVRGNGRSPRKPADQWHRPARFPNEKIRERPDRGLNPLGYPLVDDRPIMNAVKYRVVSGVVWTNRTMVSSNTDTNRTGVLEVVDIVGRRGTKEQRTQRGNRRRKPRALSAQMAPQSRECKLAWSATTVRLVSLLRGAESVQPGSSSPSGQRDKDGVKAIIHQEVSPVVLATCHTRPHALLLSAALRHTRGFNTTTLIEGYMAMVGPAFCRVFLIGLGKLRFAELLALSPATKANRVQSPAGSPDCRK